MVINSTNIYKTHLNWTQERPRHMTLESKSWLLTCTKMGGVKPVNGIPNPPLLLDNWISNNNIKKTQKKTTGSAEPVSLTFQSALRKLNTESPIGASYQISVHLTTQFQSRRLFRHLPTRNKNFLWWSCLLTNRDVIGNLYRGVDLQWYFLPNFNLFGQAVLEKIF
jgi:hypothetical protein